MFEMWRDFFLSNSSRINQPLVREPSSPRHPSRCRGLRQINGDKQ